MLNFDHCNHCSPSPSFINKEIGTELREAFSCTLGKNEQWKKEIESFGGVYSRGVVEFEIGAGNPYVWEERKEKDQPHAQSFKGLCGNGYGRGGGEPHVGFIRPRCPGNSPQDAHERGWSQSLLCQTQCFLNYRGTHEIGTREISGWEPSPLALLALRPCHRLCHTSYTQAGPPPGETDVDGKGSSCPHPCLSVPVKQGLPTCLCYLPPQTNLGIQELDSLGSILPCVSDLASLSLRFTIFKMGKKSFLRGTQDMRQGICKE